MSPSLYTSHSDWFTLIIFSITVLMSKRGITCIRGTEDIYIPRNHHTRFYFSWFSGQPLNQLFTQTGTTTRCTEDTCVPRNLHAKFHLNRFGRSTTKSFMALTQTCTGCTEDACVPRNLHTKFYCSRFNRSTAKSFMALTQTDTRSTEDTCVPRNLHTRLHLSWLSGSTAMSFIALTQTGTRGTEDNLCPKKSSHQASSQLVQWVDRQNVQSVDTIQAGRQTDRLFFVYKMSLSQSLSLPGFFHIGPGPPIAGSRHTDLQGPPGATRTAGPR